MFRTLLYFPQAHTIVISHSSIVINLFTFNQLDVSIIIFNCKFYFYNVYMLNLYHLKSYILFYFNMIGLYALSLIGADFMEALPDS